MSPAEAAALNCGMGSQPGPDREGGGGRAAAVAGGAEVVSAAAPKRIGSACSTDRLSETSLIPASRATADVAEGSTEGGGGGEHAAPVSYTHLTLPTKA